MGVFYGQVSQNTNSSVKRRGFTDESRNRDFHIIRTKNPHKFHIFRDDLRVIFTLSGFMHLSVYRDVPRARSSCAGFIRNFFTDIIKNHYICSGSQN